MSPRWLLVTSLALAGCGARREAAPVAIAPPAPDPVALTPINAGLSAPTALWRLRTGLNVAALACDPGLAERYNSWLAAHARALETARAVEEAAYMATGDDGRTRYDDQQTRIYNFWAQPHGRVALCAAADGALAALAAVDDAGLVIAAPGHLAALDHALAPPRLEVDPRVLTGPSRVMMASR